MSTLESKIDINGIDVYSDDTNDDSDDFDNLNSLNSIWDSIMNHTLLSQSNTLSDDFPSNQLSLAIHRKLNQTSNSIMLNPFINDSIRTYLEVPALILVKHVNGERQIGYAMDPTFDLSGTCNLSSSELYVGNLPSTTTPEELKIWFANKNYSVSSIDIKMNKKGSRYAFVYFDSINIAAQVLYNNERNSSTFRFGTNILKIARPIRNRVNLASISTHTTVDQNTFMIKSFPISDVYYGALITGAAMRNINHKNAFNMKIDNFGIIAHRLDSGSPCLLKFSFQIDVKRRTFAIKSITYIDGNTIGRQITLIFQWNFQDLKPRKITPVLINKNEIFLLLEVKRPPMITEVTIISTPFSDQSDELRLPGYGVIGHANAWLFKFSNNSFYGNFRTFFEILGAQNLCRRQFCHTSILSLIHPISSAERNLENVQLISNDNWVKENQEKVDNFLHHRWPMYSFETKFEIMKLISKHIITVYDLIVDDNADILLKNCTINTLIALTDQIVEFAPRWFPTTCDNDQDNLDNHNKQEEAQSTETFKEMMTDVPLIPSETLELLKVNLTVIDNSIHTDHIRKSTSELKIDECVVMSRNLCFGTFYRLLVNAFKMLAKKNVLRQTKNGIYVTKSEARTIDKNPYLVRKIYITPSTIFYEGPYCEEKCAITREFERYQDRFLRVAFRDENYEMLHNYTDNMSKMYERIKNILINGICICDQNYEFLAFSSSQLREHSCWMFASVPLELTADSIRRWMGDFRNVKPVAKLAARLGQLFSLSTQGIKLKNERKQDFSDVEKYENKDGRNRVLCFTDGIGIVSKRFARQLGFQLKLSDDILYPSAFQIRCGGYKGMVCVDIANRIKYDDIDIYFRQSMKKFDTKNLSVDIIRTSLNPSNAFLNRQIILLLSCLGIHDGTFISLQRTMLQQIESLISDPKQACEALRILNELDGNGYHRFLITYLRRIGKKMDPFIRKLLITIQIFLVKEIRTKARIYVDDSWCLLGVIDETKTLKYGQVFIQLDDTHQKKEYVTNKIIQGPVIVTRNPCFHPGDIRKLEAVDVPALHELKNVIVFPMDLNGPCPHPMEMSGGDLDGDVFWISSNPTMIFEKNEEPFNYQEQEEEANQAQTSAIVQYTIKDVCNFFGEYMAADNLGVIANRHLAFADQLVDGPKSGICLKLAKMHSVAVDFPKSGKCAPKLTKEFRPEAYPHFMEKNDKTSYHSTSILGKLYDQLQHHKIDSSFDINDEPSSFPYDSFLIDGYEDYLEDARIMKYEYDRDLNRVMKQYGIKAETEIVTGYILRLFSRQYSKKTKAFELRNEISHAYNVIRNKYLQIFWEEFFKETSKASVNQVKWTNISQELTWRQQVNVFNFYGSSSSYDEVKKKASAWFYVTYEPWKSYGKRINNSKNQIPTARNELHNDLFSFAWLPYPVLWDVFDENNDT